MILLRLALLSSALACSSAAPAPTVIEHRGGGGQSSQVESVLPCQDGVVFLDEKRDAICPCYVPDDGAVCCQGSDSWCGAVSSGCRFDRCATVGDRVEASCSGGKWHTKSAACEACPRTDCAADQLCVTWVSREGEITECRDDPCERHPLSCACAGLACAPHGGHCAQELLGGTRVYCLIPHS